MENYLKSLKNSSEFARTIKLRVYFNFLLIIKDNSINQYEKFNIKNKS